jgi:hypothetical protein
MINKIFIQENLHIYEPRLENIWGSGVPPLASVDLVEWIKEGIADGTFAGAGSGANLSIGALGTTSITIANSGGTGVILPMATNTTAGLMTSAQFSSIDSLVTLTGVPINSTNLGVFTAGCLNNTETIKSALQSLGGCIDTKAPHLIYQDEGIATGLLGTIGTINFVGAAVSATQAGSVLTVTVSASTSGLTIASEKVSILTPTALNTIPTLSPVPLDSTKVLFFVNAALANPGITCDALGVVTVTPATLGYNVETDDQILVHYFA